MADKLIYIPYNDTQNYAFCRLQLVVEKYKTFGSILEFVITKAVTFITLSYFCSFIF